MSTTTAKQSNFVSEPIKDKPVTAIPGIGPVIGERLKKEGFTKASQVYGQYLVKGEAGYKQWLKQDPIRAGNKHAEDSARALREYCDSYL